MSSQRRCLVVASCLFLLGGCVAGPYDTGGRSGRSHPPPREDQTIGSRGEFAQLARELDERAGRAHEVAERQSTRSRRGDREFFARIENFRDRTHLFRQNLENGRLAGERLHSALQDLREAARETDRSLQGADVSSGFQQEWREVQRVLDRMITLIRR